MPWVSMLCVCPQLSRHRSVDHRSCSCRPDAHKYSALGSGFSHPRPFERVENPRVFLGDGCGIPESGVLFGKIQTFISFPRAPPHPRSLHHFAPRDFNARQAHACINWCHENSLISHHTIFVSHYKQLPPSKLREADRESWLFAVHRSHEVGTAHSSRIRDGFSVNMYM